MGYRPPQILPINSYDDWDSAPDPKEWYLDYATAPIWVAGIQYYSDGTEWVSSIAKSIASSDLTALRSAILLDPTIAPPVGAKYKLTDGLLSGRVVEWNGESFSPSAGTIVYSRSSYSGAPIFSRTSDNSTDTADSEMISVLIPGFLMSSHSILDIQSFVLSDNLNSAGANTKTFTIQYGTDGEGFGAIGTPGMSGTTIAADYRVTMRNCGTLGKQVVLNTQTGLTAGSILEINRSTNADFYIKLKCKWGGNCAVASSIYLLAFSIIFR